MKYLFAFFILCLSLVACRRQALNRRDIIQEINKTKGGVLGKDGKITSCELVVIDNKAAIVAASCLNYILGNRLDSKTEYAVYLDGGNDKIRGAYKVENITVHPAYNPDNYANNLAILEFNKGSNVTIQNNIAPVGPDYAWIEKGYTLEVMSNATLEGMEYNYMKDFGVSDQLCSDYSDLYKENSKDMTCYLLLVISPASWHNCSIPFGSLYGYASNNKAYTIGLHSYTVLVGTDLCDYDKTRSYFTTLAPYLGFIKKTLNRDIKTDEDFFKVDIDNFDPDYTMTGANAVNSGVSLSAKLISGNLFTDPDTPSGPPAESSSNDEASDNGESSNDSNPNNNSGSSNKKVIIIAVCVSVGGVAVIAIVSFLLWKRCQKRKRTVDPIKEMQYQEAMAVEIGGVTVPALSPRSQQLQASTEPNAEEDAILELRYESRTQRSNDVEVYHADLPPMYEEAVDRSPVSSSKDDKKTGDKKA